MSPAYVLTKLLPPGFSRPSSLGFLSPVVLALILFLSSPNVHSVDVTLTWNPNTEETLAGYRIFCRQEGQSYDYNNPVWDGTDTTCSIYNLDDYAAYYFVARAFNTSRNESGDSNEVCYQPSQNDPPAADAGPDQAVFEGETVTLDGSNSTDPDGIIVSYLWTQTDATRVTLSDPREVQPIFTAPYVGTSSQVLNSQLTVTDDGGLSDTDSVMITVYPSPSGSIQTIFDLKARARFKRVRLSWSSLPDATCYNVYRSLTSGGPYIKIANCHVTNRCTYVDQDVVNGVTYYYVVRSVTGRVESLDSNEVSAAPSRRRRIG